MSVPLLSLRGVSAYYGSVAALRGVDLDVNEGEIVTLIGANGAGKSTLMMTVFGAPRARSGTIHYAGQDITGLATHAIARLGLAQSPEGRRVFPRMSVQENLQMGAALHGGRHFGQDLEKVCTLFPRLKERLSQRAGTMSGGEQQMLAIGRALMSRPLVVKQIFSAISALNREEGMTIFLVEQNAYHALKLAHRGSVLVNGRITLSGPARALLDDPSIKAAYLEGGHAPVAAAGEGV